jgi:hypothetical protein
LKLLSYLKGTLMRVALRSIRVVVLVCWSTGLLLTGAARAQEGPEANRKIAGGGITAPGWMGTVDADSAKAGQSEKDAKLVQKGGEFDVTTGPAITYWNPKNVASGDYMVSATFTEPKFMNLNDHPHPYGVFIGGNDMGTGSGSLLYCAAYGSGTFIVRGFGPDAFQMGGRRPTASDAVHKAAGVGQPVTQEIAMSVKGGSVSCSINGTVVATYDKAAVVTAGKLKSTDGVYGIRFAHNTEAVVTNLKVTKP